MAQYTYRANLSASSFPLLATNAGRTVMIPQQDNTYNRIIANTKSDDTIRDVGIPQIYYCENVMPTEHGFQSISYDTVVPPFSDNFEAIYRIRSKQGTVGLLAVTNNSLYVLEAGVWIYKFATSSSKLTVANVEGQSYICLSYLDVLEWDSIAGTLVSVTLTGLNKTKVIGIISAGGYLVAYNETDINWSSTIDPKDFTPSLATGAGGGKVEGVKATIVTAAPILNGIIIYSSLNAVAAILSGNNRYPFVFREIVGAGGITDSELVANDPVSGEQYAYTTAGLQRVTSTGATTSYPEITDFIAGRVLETFDFATGEFTRRGVTAPLVKKLTVVSNRYILMSYGIATLDEVIVVDIATRRLGKLKNSHVDIIDWNLATGVDTDTPKKSIGMLKSDGSVDVVSFDPYKQSQGVIVLGKYQHVRARGLQMLKVIADNIYPSNTCELKVLTSLKGKDTDYAKLLTPFSTDSFSREYLCNVTGLNHSIALKGSFDLNSLVLTYTLGGDR